jgi:hypothetical protein
MRSDYDGYNSYPGSEENLLRIIRTWQVRDLVGKLLTYVDATYTDKTQRDAQKDIVRSLVYTWFEQDCKWPEITDEVEKLINEKAKEWEAQESVPTVGSTKE